VLGSRRTRLDDHVLVSHLAQSLQPSVPLCPAAPSLVAPSSPNPLALRRSNTESLLHPLSAATEPRPPSFPSTRPSRAPRLFPADQTFGHPLPRLSGPNCLCLGYTNVAGFPVEALNNSKAMELRAFLTHHQIDIFVGCESNIN